MPQLFITQQQCNNIVSKQILRQRILLKLIFLLKVCTQQQLVLLRCQSYKYFYYLPSHSVSMATTDSRVSQHHNTKLNRIIDTNNSNLEDNVKERVKQKLAQDAEFLLEKKRREDEKRDRVKKMEQEFERERLKKLNKMSEKQAKSEGLLQKNKEQLNKKHKRNSENFNKIISKISHENEQQIEKALHLQKQLQSNDNNSKTFSRTSKDANLLNSGRSHSVRLQMQNIDDKIAHIMSKGNRAKQMHEEQTRMMVNRIKQRSSSVNQAQKRAHYHSYIEESEKLRNYYEKTEQLHKLAENSKTNNERRLSEKRRSVKQKLDKCSENLKYLSDKQEQKYQELEIKFSKKVQPKQWKDARLEKYKQKWEENKNRLEIEKEMKAENILQKHQQISQQNRVYKEQKDKLIQAVKSAN